MKLYEQDYVDERIGRIITTYVEEFIFYHYEYIEFRYLPDLRSILLDLTDAVEGRTAVRQVSEPTKIKPFNMTAPKARIVPIPKIV